MTIPNVHAIPDPNNPDIITIDASSLDSDQRSILAEIIGWDSSNPLSLVQALLHDSMVKRSFEMDRVIEQRASAATAATKTALSGN